MIRQNLPGLLPKETFSDLSICIAGYYEKAAGHSCLRPVVTEYQLAYCVAGKGAIMCQGKTVAIGRGDVFINIPGFPHEYHADAKDPWTHYWVHFTGPAAGQYFELMQCRPDEPGFNIGYNERLIELYREMLVLLPRDDPPHQVRALALLHNILSLVIVLRQQAGLSGNPGRQSLLLDMAAIDLYITDHLSDIRLKRLAAFAAVSVPHFIRLLTERTGYTPMQYVARKRIIRACQLLADSPAMNIKRVAADSGVDDQHYFSRLFKKVTGMTPLQYRRMTVQSVR